MEIRQRFSTLYKALFTTTARYIHLWGGRGRGGSHTGTAYFLHLLTRPEYFRGCFLRAIAGDVRASLWRDLKDRIEDAGIPLHYFILNETLMSVTYIPTGNTIISKGFKKSSTSQSAKLKSLAGITHVLIEETEEVAEEDFMQLDDSLRTTKVENIQIMCLFNPPHRNHWLIRKYYTLLPCGLVDKFGKPLPWYKAQPRNNPALLSIHSTYLDNLVNLNASTISNYREYGNAGLPTYNEDKYHRDVLGMVSEGKNGRILSKVYPITYAQFASLPYSAFGGLDFGYSEDPTALNLLKYHNGRGYVHQLIYEPGLTNSALAARMRQVGVNPKMKIYADAAEPKSIAELKGFGFNVVAADKGPDSLRAGIKHLQDMELYVTEESKETWTEVQEYSWALDSLKNPTDEPIDKYNHSWDASRYGFTMNKKPSSGKVGVHGGDESADDLSWL